MANWPGLQRLAIALTALSLGSQVLAQFCRSDVTVRGNAGGAACVFPFQYRNVYYTECTPIDNRGIKWCSTTANFDAEQRWGACVCDLASEPASCSDLTTDGATCARPFQYKGRAYYGCTTLDNNGVAWCSLDAVYAGSWGRCGTTTCPTPGCRSDITDGGNSNRAACAFPFTYKGVSYSACTDIDNKGVRWCSTTNNFDANGKWGRCICDVVTPAPTGQLYCRTSPTVLGNSGGSPCVFPFLYRGVYYDECTVADNNNVKWCATTSNYGVDGRWGRCVCDLTATPNPTQVPLFCRSDATTGGTGNGRACSFPFIYGGNLYSECIILDNNNQPWCSNTGNYDVDFQWGACICDQYTTISPTVALPPCLSTVTAVGNSGGAACFFPFVYKQRTYYACTTADNRGVRWCSTTPDYDIDGRWGRCICDASIPTPATPTPSGCQTSSTTNGQGGGGPCVFPFNYKGNSYSDCITLDNQGVYWCSMTANFDINRQWGNCICTAPTPAPAATQAPGPAVTPTNAPTTCTERTIDGRPCSLPFIYRGTSYNGCINLDNMNTFWCSLTPNYDSDLQWANCATPICNPVTAAPAPVTLAVYIGPCRADITEAGNANGAACVFPFIYKGVAYSQCTLVDNPRLWCATTASYDANQQWGRCICLTTASTTQAPTFAPAQTPSTAGTPSPFNCRTDATTGGNGFNVRCIFPFKYMNQMWTSCITILNNGQPWCAVTPDYDRDELWGNCICAGFGTDAPITTPTTPGDSGAGQFTTQTTQGSTTGTTPFRGPSGTTPFTGGCRDVTMSDGPCLTSWVYNGETYTGCTTQGFNGVYWCSLDPVYIGNFGLCQLPVCAAGRAPAPANPAPAPAPAPAPTPAPASGQQCTVFTANGQCVFPFRYNTFEFNNCTTTDNGNILWCSLTENYNVEGLLGICTDFSGCRG